MVTTFTFSGRHRQPSRLYNSLGANRISDKFTTTLRFWLKEILVLVLLYGFYPVTQPMIEKQSFSTTVYTRLCGMKLTNECQRRVWRSRWPIRFKVNYATDVYAVVSGTFILILWEYLVSNHASWMKSSMVYVVGYFGRQQRYMELQSWVNDKV